MITVKQLREVADRHSLPTFEELRRLLGEAAEEIERLQNELDAANEDLAAVQSETPDEDAP
jgi:hypothetical protein